MKYEEETPEEIAYWTTRQNRETAILITIIIIALVIMALVN